jgi:hypothetical protein
MFFCRVLRKTLLLGLVGREINLLLESFLEKEVRMIESVIIFQLEDFLSS